MFERLNTGGVQLTRQEIRNALYRGRVNNLIDRLSRRPNFRAAWGVPPYVENETDVTPGLLEIPMYAKMEDVEMVLRFFALRHAANYRHGMQGFLDLYMRRAASFTDADVTVLDRRPAAGPARNAGSAADCVPKTRRPGVSLHQRKDHEPQNHRDHEDRRDGADAADDPGIPRRERRFLAHRCTPM